MSNLRKRSLELNVDPWKLKFSLIFREEMGVVSSDEKNEDSTIEMDEVKTLDHQSKAESEIPNLKKLLG